MSQRFFFLMVLLLSLLWAPAVMAQTQEALPGCTLAWSAPMMDDPDNPGTQISSWEHAGDHKGFVFNTRKDDQHTWDKLLEQKVEDPSLLQIACPQIGVEELGTYSVGITAEDHALNQSPPAWITFNIIAPDSTALPGVAQSEICLQGKDAAGRDISICQRPNSP